MTDKTKIRGNKQIKSLTITNADIATDAAIETNKLAEGQEFLKRDGSVPLTGDLDANGNKIENLAAPVGDNDAARKIDIDSADQLIQQNIDEQSDLRQDSDDAFNLRLDDIDLKNTQQDGELIVAESDINQLEIDLAAEESARAAGDTNIQNLIDEATNGAFVSREIPSGLIDGINSIFVLAHTPQLNSEKVYINGALQKSGVGNDYTIVDDTITFTNPPIVDDVILVNYFYDGIITGGGTVDLSEIEEDIDNLQADIISLDGRLDSAELDVDSLQTESFSLDTRIDLLETSTGDTSQIEADIDALEIRATTAESNIGIIQTDLVNIDTDIDSLEIDKNSLATVATSGSYNDLLNKPASTGGMSRDWQFFGSSGTWTKPAGAKLVQVICVSGGTGGSFGSTNSAGGAGGQSGPVAMAWFDAAGLSNTETVTVGLGGDGGISSSVFGKAGGASFFGGISTPNCKLASQPPTSGQTGGNILTTLTTFTNNGGGNGNGGGTNPVGGNARNVNLYAAHGGAGGGGINNSNIWAAGGDRTLLERNFGYYLDNASNNPVESNTGGQTEGANGINGLNAITDGSSCFIFGGGASGAAGSTVQGGRGGDGGIPGGGGGGGGGVKTSAFPSSVPGNGGNGGNGGVYVISYF